MSDTVLKPRSPDVLDPYVQHSVLMHEMSCGTWLFLALTVEDK